MEKSTKYIVIIIILVVVLAISISCKNTPPQPIAPEQALPAKQETPQTNPAGPPPGTLGAANDDVVSAPGGFTYRAGIHQEGQPDWPPVQEKETTIKAISGTIDFRYRDYIETKAGETKNNIIFLFGQKAPDLLDPLQVNYVAVDLPNGISIQRDQQMYGGIGGQDKKSSRVVLRISIASQVKPGEYPFAIQLEYEGKEFGSLPCTVKVLK